MALFANIRCRTLPLALVVLWGLSHICPMTVMAGPQIQVGVSASWADKHAAEELKKYLQLLTGDSANIVRSDELKPSLTTFLIGTIESNVIISRLVQEGQISFAGMDHDRDGFLIKSIRDKTQDIDIIMLAGNNGRSTLYAVYDYLEDDCGIGFFPDGEYIPSLKSLPLKNIDRVENARFQNRYNLRWDRVVMKKYTTRWHSWPELKEVIDWEAKKKFNVRTSSSIQTEGRAMGDVIEKVFDLPPEPEELCAIHDDWWYLNWFLPLDFNTDRKDKALAYSRKLGFRGDIGVPYGVVPRRYKQSHPEHIYVSYAGFNLLPKDPAATRFTKEVLRRTIERFGTDHFYSMNPYGEQAPGKNPLQLKMDASLKTAQIFRELDDSPEMLWRMDAAWDFMVNPGGIWNQETARQYLDAMPDFMYIADNCFDLIANIEDLKIKYKEPMYKVYNYYYGKKWALAPINDLGGDDQLHGNLPDVVQKVQEVITDPRGSNCIGFHFTPENANCCIMYWNCLTRLAWNPEGWTVDKLIDDYCVHRYGAQSAPQMARCWRILVDNMHLSDGGNFGNRPLYQIFLRFDLSTLTGQFPHRLSVACNVGPEYRKALQIALAEWDNQRDNKLYESDLIDIVRSYIGKLSDLHIINALTALDEKKMDEYRSHRAKTIDLMMLSAKVMSTRADYSLSDTIKQIMAVPGANRYTEVGLKMSQYGQGYDTFDNYEQMIYCYIPQVEYVLDWHEGKYGSAPLATGSKNSDNPIKRPWLNSPLTPPAETKFQGTPRQAIRWVIDRLDELVDKSAMEDSLANMRLAEQKQLDRLVQGRTARIPDKSSEMVLRSDFDGEDLDNNWHGTDVKVYRGIAAVGKMLKSDALRGKSSLVISYSAKYHSQENDDWQSFEIRFKNNNVVAIYCQGGPIYAQLKAKENKLAAAGKADGNYHIYTIKVSDGAICVMVDQKEMTRLEITDSVSIDEIVFVSNTLSNPLAVDWFDSETIPLKTNEL